MAAEVYCDTCKKHGELTLATIEFCVRREDDPDATLQYVHCSDRHEGQEAVAAAFM